MLIRTKPTTPLQRFCDFLLNFYVIVKNVQTTYVTVDPMHWLISHTSSSSFKPSNAHSSQKKPDNFEEILHKKAYSRKYLMEKC